ncbi:MAG TPA: class III signal peptide-containing protein [Candidatus Omnitrophota bacterium]|nr:class III signal peptide-containing protein [Candidatus Omnitrophota bacterium]
MLKRDKNSTPHRKRKGQSTVEYIILVAAVLAALIAFLAPGGVFQNAFNSTVATGTNGMQNMAQRLAGSRPLSP